MSLFEFGGRDAINFASRANVVGSVKRRTSSYSTPRTNNYTLAGATGSSGPGSGGLSNRYNPVYDRLEQGSVFEDWVPRDQPGINLMFRRIYYRDVIAGPTVDIYSTIPWSGFDVTGIKDKAIRQFYEDAFQYWDTELLSTVTKELLVIGRMAGSMLYDPKVGYWRDIIVHDPDMLEINPRPVRGFNPKLDLFSDPGLREFMNSADDRDIRARSTLPQNLLDKFRGAGKVPLDEFNTLWLARRTSPYDYVGSSMLTRIVGIWAMEKALMDATVTAARRRSGSILHIKAGTDQWEPDGEEMENIAGLFVQAEEDPVGAVVLTRQGIDASEIRQGGQLWKMGDEWNFLSEAKFRALGISEAFLSGEATYDNMQTARSVMMEQILCFRHTMTRQIFHDPAVILAKAHGFRKRKQSELDHHINISPNKNDEINERIENVKLRVKLKNLPMDQALQISENELITPTIQWHKDLKPTQDEGYMGILEKMEEKGIPIPLRTWAAAGGYDLDAALGMLSEDKKLRGELAEYHQSIQPAAPAGDEAMPTESEIDSLPGKVDSLPVWNDQQFLGLRRNEALSCLDRVCAAGSTVLRSDKEMVAVVSSMWPANSKKRMAMHYILMRTGLAKKLPINEENYKNIARVLCGNNLSSRELMGELTLLSRMNREKADPRKLKAANVDGLKHLTGRHMASTTAAADMHALSIRENNNIASNSPNLLSGVTK